MQTLQTQRVADSLEVRTMLSQLDASDWKQVIKGGGDLTYKAIYAGKTFELSFSERFILPDGKPKLSIHQGERPLPYKADQFLNSEIEELARAIQSSRESFRIEARKFIESPNLIPSKILESQCSRYDLTNGGKEFQITLPMPEIEQLTNPAIVIEISHNIGDYDSIRARRPEGHSLRVTGSCDQHRLESLGIPSSKNKELAQVFKQIKDAYDKKLFNKMR